MFARAALLTFASSRIQLQFSTFDQQLLYTNAEVCGAHFSNHRNKKLLGRISRYALAARLQLLARCVILQ